MSSIINKYSILFLMLTFSITSVYAQSDLSQKTNDFAYDKSPSAALTTEKSRYTAGETVNINGQNFDNSEIISISVDYFSQSQKQSVSIFNWKVSTDDQGQFTINIPFESLYSEDGKFTARALGNNSKKIAEVQFESALPNPSADLDQCANGQFTNPMPCTGNNWQNGNVGQSQGHYYEGDSVPYRIKLDNLTTGAGNPHTLTIEWDTTQGGKHAIDYLTTYNRTESVGNNPCSGVTPACGAATTFPIPLDPNISGVGVTQLGGQLFTMFGGTITGVSAYTLTGSYAGNSSTRITITFTANQANPVLAWSGHIADRNDWAALGGSASDIPGSPYHTRLIELDGSGGGQDRSLSNVAVRLNSRIIIFTQASPQSNQTFPYSTTNPPFAPSEEDNLLAPFTLIDDGVDNDATPNNITFNNLLAPAASGTFGVTQSNSIGFYSLTSIGCVVASGGTSTFTTSQVAKLATINLQYGDTVTCTFNNAVITAASTSISGKTTDSSGFPIANTKVTLFNTHTLQSRTTYTNSFGNYSFDDAASGDLYLVSVSSKRFVFNQDTHTVFLNEAVENLNFIADLQ